MFAAKGEEIKAAVVRKQRKQRFDMEMIRDDDLLVESQREAVEARQVGREERGKTLARVEPERIVVEQLPSGSQQVPCLGGTPRFGRETVLGIAEEVLPAGEVFVLDSPRRGHQERDAWPLPVRQECAKV